MLIRHGNGEDKEETLKIREGKVLKRRCGVRKINVLE